MLACALLACCGLWPGAAPVAPGERPAHAAVVPGPGSDTPAPPSRLWVDATGRWVHQDATVFNVYLGVRDPRLRYWLAREMADWNRHTIVSMRLVRDRGWANVVALDGRYGPRSVIAWSQLCRECQTSAIYFNLDRLPIGAGSDPELRAVACHEIGHVLGLWHGGGDCMSFSYQRTNTAGIGPGSMRLVDRAYAHVRRGLPARLVALGAG